MKPTRVLAICAALFAVITGAQAAALLVPMYAYPTPTNTLWSGVQSAAATVEVTAIINPANGPGLVVDSNYATRITDLASAGATLAGYIHTTYAARPIADVKADIDTWGLLYPQITEIFIDEQSDDLTTLAYYQELYAYIAAKGYARVFTNPGTFVDEAFTTSPHIAVTSILYEDKQTLWSGFTTPSYVASRPANDFGVIVINCPSSPAMTTSIALAKARNFGYIYVTDDKGANPYDKLPTYWSAEVPLIP